METSFSFDLISHPDRTLEEHLQGCNAVSERLLSQKFIASAFYSKEKLDTIRRALVWFHDFGKATWFFQHYMIGIALREKENEDFKNKHRAYFDWFLREIAPVVGRQLDKNSGLKNHAKLGAYLVFIAFEDDDPIVEYIVCKIIRRHHGSLTNFLYKKASDIDTLGAKQIELGDYLTEELREQLTNLDFSAFNKIIAPQGWKVQETDFERIAKKFANGRAINRNARILEDEPTYRYFFLQHFLFSMLLSADKGDVMTGKDFNVQGLATVKLVPEDAVPYFKKSYAPVCKPIDELREAAFHDIVHHVKANADHHFFSITLPTGMGKTFSAYQAAFTLQHEISKRKEYLPRIIYSLPFTSVIDQNAQVLSDIFGFHSTATREWIAKHHYLSLYSEKDQEGENVIWSESEYLTEGWEHTVMVTTFVQLLESIFTDKNRALRKFHNMTNAIIVLDEVQNIPPKYFEAVEIVFRHMALYFDTRFIFVTATQPFLFEKNDDIIELTDPKYEHTRFYFEEQKRICLDQTLLKENGYRLRDFTEWIGIFKEDIAMKSEKSFLLICNTIAYSQAIFSELKKAFPNDDLIYLSSSILPGLRKEIIGKIKNRKPDDLRQIVVSTQVVEAGVDIDLDVVWRDFAPLDSINQSAGRCNRNAVKSKGVVKLFHSGKSKIYEKEFLEITQKVLQDFPTIIEESELYDLNLKYAARVREVVTDKSEESKILKEAMHQVNVADVAANFRLIDEKNIYWNVFIPYCNDAETIWQEYLKCRKIKDKFKRKTEIKKLRSRLLEYVTRFPKNNYDPPPEKQDDFIIYEHNWSNYYSLERGFLFEDRDVEILVF